MAGIFFELTFILCLAAVLSIFFRLLKQPAILAYILTGIIIGPFGQLQLGSGEFIRVMGEFGITLLLFMLGLEMRLREFRLIGKTALIVGAIQIILSFILGFWLSQALGFSSLLSFYISLALTFSSTVIVVKMLSDQKDLKSLYGKIAIGLLLVQDFLVVFILMLLSGLKTNPTIFSQMIDLGSLAFVVVKGLALFSAVILFSHTILPKFIDKIAKSEETLFLFSLAWVFGLAAVVSSRQIGFSIEIGGFLAGIALADVSENFQIIARMKALRDFFVTIFFVFLGMSMAFGSVGPILIPIIVFSAFAIVVKPLIIMAAMGVIGYRKKTSFLTGASLAQVSEFSLIIVFLGNKLGHVSSDVVSALTAVAIITFVISTYINLNTNLLYKLLSDHLSLFERKGTKREELGTDNEQLDLKQHVVLVGANRMGESILDALEDLGKKLIVVDFDPEIVNNLKGKNITSIFGDIADLEIQERANLKGAKLVISTVPDLDDNLFLIKGLNRQNRTAKIIVMAQDREDAKALYKAGADYVVLPHLSGGRHVAKILKEDKLDEIDSFKSKDLNYLS